MLGMAISEQVIRARERNPKNTAVSSGRDTPIPTARLAPGAEHLLQ